MDSTVTVLGVMTGLLGVALAVCLVVIVALLVYVRKHQTCQLSGESQDYKLNAMPLQ